MVWGHSVRGGLPDIETPGQRPPLDKDLPWTETPLGQRPLDHVTCDACWEIDPQPCGQTNTCENITLPQTSFAGGKKDFRFVVTASPKSLDPLQLDVESLHSMHFQTHFQQTYNVYIFDSLNGKFCIIYLVCV